MHAHDVALICGVVAAGFACQWIAWRVKLPAILFLLLTGIAAGPVLGVLDTDALFGDLLVPVVSIAVAIILFEGSLTLKFRELRGHGTVVTNLVTFGALITWAVAGLAAWAILGWDPYLAALFGAIVIVSGPTVVMPLLRTVRPNAAVASVLRWEAILIDPLGALLALVVFEFIVATQASEGMLHGLRTFGLVIGAGLVLGAVGGQLLGMAIRARKIPDFLRNYAGLAAALAIFAAAESVRGESGLLAVTVMGVWLANMRRVELQDVLSFKESLTLVLVAALFIVLAARLDVGKLYALGWGALAVFAVIQLVGGPLRSFLCAMNSKLSLREKSYLGWVFPRGIVAAAISSIFALRLEQSGMPNADSLVPLVFMIIIGTVILQSVSARPMARWLGVAEPSPTGVLIVGANRAAIAIAEALRGAGIRVLVTDSHWAGIREARMRGIDTFYGSAVSGYADDNLQLTGLGNLLAMSRKPGLNELACMRFAHDFGRDHVFTVKSVQEGEHGKHKVSGERIGRVLFNGELSLEKLVGKVLAGCEIVLTELTDEYSYGDYRERHADSVVVFAVDPRGRVRFPVGDESTDPGPGWKVAALRKPRN